MDKKLIEELFEMLGYSGDRLIAVCRYFDEYARRKSRIEGGEPTASDIVTVSLMFDGFNRSKKGK